MMDELIVIDEVRTKDIGRNHSKSTKVKADEFKDGGQVNSDSRTKDEDKLILMTWEPGY